MTKLFNRNCTVKKFYSVSCYFQLKRDKSLCLQHIETRYMYGCKVNTFFVCSVFILCFFLSTLKISPIRIVVAQDPVGSELFGRILIRGRIWIGIK
jgi:hypothetical protein